MNVAIFTKDELERLSNDQLSKLIDYLGLPKYKQRARMISSLVKYFKPKNDELPLPKNEDIMIDNVFKPISSKVRRIYERMYKDE